MTSSCECRWCVGPTEGRLVIFVTLPANWYADVIADPNHDLIADAIVGTSEKSPGSTWVPEKKIEYINRVVPGIVTDRENFGRLLIPPGGFFRDVDDIVELRMPWACDNGSFGEFDEPAMYKMLEHVGHKPFCHFVACPDVVWNRKEIDGVELRAPKTNGPDDPGNFHLSAKATIAKFKEWAPIIKDYGLPAAMVGQDGLEQYDIPWDLMDAYFVGGSDHWKTSVASEHIIREAKARGLWVHVGRVSGGLRMNWAKDVGADSIDGSALGRFRGAQDKRDGQARLLGALNEAMEPLNERLFITTLEGDHQ